MKVDKKKKTEIYIYLCYTKTHENRNHLVSPSLINPPSPITQLNPHPSKRQLSLSLPTYTYKSHAYPYLSNPPIPSPHLCSDLRASFHLLTPCTPVTATVTTPKTALNAAII